MDLWRYYIDFVIGQQGQNWDVITEENTAEKRDQSISEIQNAYEHCLYKYVCPGLYEHLEELH